MRRRLRTPASAIFGFLNGYKGSRLNRNAISLRACILTAAAVVLCVCGSVHAGTQEPAAQNAAETFQARCSTCHAEHGEGSEVGASLNVPDLRSPAVQRNEDAQLRQIIKGGKGNMPSFGRDFSDEEVDRLLQLIRSFAGRPGQQTQPAAR